MKPDGLKPAVQLGVPNVILRLAGANILTGALPCCAALAGSV